MRNRINKFAEPKHYRKTINKSLIDAAAAAAAAAAATAAAAAATAAAAAAVATAAAAAAAKATRKHHLYNKNKSILLFFYCVTNFMKQLIKNRLCAQPTVLVLLLEHEIQNKSDQFVSENVAAFFLQPLSCTESRNT